MARCSWLAGSRRAAPGWRGHGVLLPAGGELPAVALLSAMRVAAGPARTSSAAPCNTAASIATAAASRVTSSCSSLSLGVGCAGHGVLVGHGVRVGHGVLVGSGVRVSHGVLVGSGVAVARGVDVGRGV